MFHRTLPRVFTWGQRIAFEDASVRGCLAKFTSAKEATLSGNNMTVQHSAVTLELADIERAVQLRGSVAFHPGEWVAGITTTGVSLAGPIVAVCTFVPKNVTVVHPMLEKFRSPISPRFENARDLPRDDYLTLIETITGSDHLKHGIAVIWPNEIHQIMKQDKEDRFVRRAALVRAVRLAMTVMNPKEGDIKQSTHMYIDGRTEVAGTKGESVFYGFPCTLMEVDDVNATIMLARALAWRVRSRLLYSLHLRYPNYDFPSLLEGETHLSKAHLYSLCIFGTIRGVHVRSAALFTQMTYGKHLRNEWTAKTRPPPLSATQKETARTCLDIPPAEAGTPDHHMHANEDEGVDLPKLVNAGFKEVYERQQNLGAEDRQPTPPNDIPVEIRESIRDAWAAEPAEDSDADADESDPPVLVVVQDDVEVSNSAATEDVVDTNDDEIEVFVEGAAVMEQQVPVPVPFVRDCEEALPAPERASVTTQREGEALREQQKLSAGLVPAGDKAESRLASKISMLLQTHSHTPSTPPPVHKEEVLSAAAARATSDLIAATGTTPTNVQKAAHSNTKKRAAKTLDDVMSEEAEGMHTMASLHINLRILLYRIRLAEYPIPPVTVFYVFLAPLCPLWSKALRHFQSCP